MELRFRFGWNVTLQRGQGPHKGVLTISAISAVSAVSAVSSSGAGRSNTSIITTACHGEQ
jgi:hypothetical protein